MARNSNAVAIQVPTGVNLFGDPYWEDDIVTDDVFAAGTSASAEFFSGVGNRMVTPPAGVPNTLPEFQIVAAQDLPAQRMMPSHRTSHPSRQPIGGFTPKQPQPFTAVLYGDNLSRVTGGYVQGSLATTTNVASSYLGWSSAGGNLTISQGVGQGFTSGAFHSTGVPHKVFAAFYSPGRIYDEGWMFSQHHANAPTQWIVDPSPLLVDYPSVVEFTVASPFEAIKSLPLVGLALGRRLRELQELRREEGEDFAEMSEDSIWCFYAALSSVSFIMLPRIALTDDGEIYATWRKDEHRVFSAHFLSSGDVQYLITRPDPIDSSRVLRNAGLASAGTIFVIPETAGASWAFR